MKWVYLNHNLSKSEIYKFDQKYLVEWESNITENLLNKLK